MRKSWIPSMIFGVKSLLYQALLQKQIPLQSWLITLQKKRTWPIIMLHSRMPWPWNSSTKVYHWMHLHSNITDLVVFFWKLAHGPQRLSKEQRTNNKEKRKKSGRWRGLFGVKCAGGRGNTTYTPEASPISNFNLRSPSD